MKNNFEQAYNYINKNYTEEDICNILNGKDDIQKAAAILQIKDLDNDLSKLLIFYYLIYLYNLNIQPLLHLQTHN